MREGLRRRTHAAVATRSAFVSLLALVLGIAGMSSDAEGGAERSGCAWSEDFRLDWFNNAALAFAQWDDGNGLAVYVGGPFSRYGDLTPNGVARWDGVAWSALTGPGGTGVNGLVFALAVYDDGSGPALYVGGAFDTVGGVPSRHLALWRCAQGALVFVDGFESGDTT